MNYFYQKGTDEKTLVVGFHGTGDNEYQLLTIIAKLYPDASILTYLGEVGKGNARRYFEPLENGQLPKESLTAEVENFLTNDWPKFSKTAEKVIFIGFSNGANFILGLLQKQAEIADTVILLHPAPLAFQFEEKSDQTQIFITTGSQDSQVLPGKILAFSKKITEFFPKTQLQIVDGEHGITEDEIKKIQALL